MLIYLTDYNSLKKHIDMIYLVVADFETYRKDALNMTSSHQLLKSGKNFISR